MNAKLTKSQKAALKRFNAGPFAPRYGKVRTDVAQRLYDAGLVISHDVGDSFRAGYATLKISAAGRQLLREGGLNRVTADRGRKATP